jgi:hypothetical protein
VSDPPRLRDLEGEIPEDVRRLLSRTPAVRPMSARERADVSRTALWLTVAPVGLAAFWSAGRALAAAAVVGTIAVGTGFALRARHHHAPAVAATPRRRPAALVVPTVAAPVVAPIVVRPTAATTVAPPRRVARPTAVVPAPEPAVVEAPPAPPSPVAVVASAPSPGSTSSAAPRRSETAMLLDARALLPRDPAAALAVLDAHHANFPRGQLADEREFMAVEALRRLGRGAEADARAEALVRASPASPYARLLRRRTAP